MNDKIQKNLKILEELTQIITYICKEEQEEVLKNDYNDFDSIAVRRDSIFQSGNMEIGEENTRAGFNQ